MLTVRRVKSLGETDYTPSLLVLKNPSSLPKSF